MTNSAVKPTQIIDVAVVGGGVSGAYAAWRLASDRKSSKIHLYELSDRIGGRLLSMTMPGMPHVQAEFGGMYVTQSQAIVWELIKLLNLKTTVVDFSSPGVRAYIRDRHLLISEFNQPDKVPYNLRPDEDFVGLNGCQQVTIWGHKIHFNFPHLGEFLWLFLLRL